MTDAILALPVLALTDARLTLAGNAGPVDIDAVEFTGHLTQSQMEQGAISQALRGIRCVGAAKMQDALTFRSRKEVFHPLHEGNGRTAHRHATTWYHRVQTRPFGYSVAHGR